MFFFFKKDSQVLFTDHVKYQQLIILILTLQIHLLVAYIMYAYLDSSCDELNWLKYVTRPDIS